MKSSLTYWQKTCRLTISFLLFWFLLTFVLNWYARELNQFTFLEFPLGFYLAAQGEMLIYLLIIWTFNRRMNALDAEFRIDDE